MRSKVAVGGLTVVVAFLLATNPMVVDAAGQITGAQIKDNSIKGKDVKDHSLAGKDVKPNSLTGTEIAESSLAGVNASALNGLASSAFASAAQPAFTTAVLGAGYTQFGGGTTPGFMRDSLGFVHLKGMLDCPSSGTAFTLPAGFRPAQTFFFPMAVGSSGAGNVQVLPSGVISTFNADGAAHPCALDGVVFRTDTTARPAAGRAGNPND
jgi:hypothetical protein